MTLELRAHFKRHAGAKGVASNAVGAIWLQLSDALHIVGCQGLNAVQRSSWGGKRWLKHMIRMQMALMRDVSTGQSQLRTWKGNNVFFNIYY